MSIPMEIPAQFLPRVDAGTLIRYGCVLKDVGSGKIVGHLKEVGQVGRWLGDLSVNPLIGGTSSVVQVGQWIDTHQRLRHIQTTLNHLQLISSVGAIASVCGLGVSVAGFAVIMQRLHRLESKLDEAMDKMRAEVERVHLRLDMLAGAELRTASERLAGCRFTEHDRRSVELLKDSDHTFQRYRNYYFSLIEGLRPYANPGLSIPQAGELLGRYFLCSWGELQANFQLVDFSQWFFRHQQIQSQVAVICELDQQESLRKRANAMVLVPDQQLKEMTAQLFGAKEFCTENKARIATADVEVKWLQREQIAPEDYIAELEKAPDEGVVLVPHHPE